MQEGWVILLSTKGKRIICYIFAASGAISIFSVIALVIIFLVLPNLQVTNAQLIFNFEDPSMLVGTSETLRMFSSCLCSNKDQIKGNDVTDLKVRQWIAGVIDGDGNFHISKKGYVELSIVMEPRDIACLYKIKQRYLLKLLLMQKLYVFDYIIWLEFNTSLKMSMV